MAQNIVRSATEAERRRIQEIIDRHQGERPEGVRRVDFNFGEDHAGNPAVYLKLFVGKDMQPSKEKIEELNDFVQVLLNEILNDEFEYWPYAQTIIEDD